MADREVSIRILLEDRTRKRGLKGEHGLSILVKTQDSTLLFDTGQSGLFLENAEKLELSLSSVDGVVLSHGHYDHGGGLSAFFSRKGKFKLYAHPEAFKDKYHKEGIGKRDIGIPWSLEAMIERGIEFIPVTAPKLLSGGEILTGPIERIHLWDQNIVGWVGKERDSLPDEQALLLPSSRGLIVIVGCAHAGLINTLEYVRRISEDKRIRAVIGGFHMLERSDEAIRSILEKLDEFDVNLWAPCHCSGIRAQAAFLRHYPQNTVLVDTGAELVFHGD